MIDVVNHTLLGIIVMAQLEYALSVASLGICLHNVGPRDWEASQ